MSGASESYWRRKSREIVAATIQSVGSDNPKTLHAALIEAYPFGERKHWPYKVWLDEIQRQLHTGKHAPIPFPESEPGPLMGLME